MKASTTPMLVAQGLTRRFGGLIAVDDVSFEVNSGEVFGLIGPNGAGKTTLFNMITGLTIPSSGHLFHQGKDITGWAPHRIVKRRIARTFQNIRLFGNLSALENVLIAQHIHLHSGLIRAVLNLPATAAEEKLAHDRSLAMLAMVGLADRSEIQARNFAYGDQRRLEIARALALEPQLLLLDEPAAGLNPAEKDGLSALIRQIAAEFKLTIVLIEHNVPLVMALCDRVAVLNFGKVVTVGLPSEVQKNPAVIEAYLGESPAEMENALAQIPTMTEKG